MLLSWEGLRQQWVKTWKGRQERGQFDVHKRRIRAKGKVFRNRCWKQGNLSTVSSRGTVMVLPPIVDLHLDVMQTLSEGGGTELLPQRPWLLLSALRLYVSCFLLNYLSQASVLHYLYVTSWWKWENACSFLICPLTANVPCSFQVSFLLLYTHICS